MKLYKFLIPITCFLFSFNLMDAQEENEKPMVFNYDAGGKLIERKIQVMAGGRIGRFNLPKDSAKVDEVQREFKVYPNPTSQFINIDGPLPDKTKSGDLILVNVSGQVLKKDTYTGQTKTLVVSDLKPGLYLLQIWYSKKQKSTYKIIITN